jgi:hypothetical protein
MYARHQCVHPAEMVLEDLKTGIIVQSDFRTINYLSESMIHHLLTLFFEGISGPIFVDLQMFDNQRIGGVKFS